MKAGAGEVWVTSGLLLWSKVSLKEEPEEQRCYTDLDENVIQQKTASVILVSFQTIECIKRYFSECSSCSFLCN